MLGAGGAAWGAPGAWPGTEAVSHMCCCSLVPVKAPGGAEGGARWELGVPIGSLGTWLCPDGKVGLGLELFSITQQRSEHLGGQQKKTRRVHPSLSWQC